MHCSMPFYTRDLSIQGSGYHGRMQGRLLDLVPYGHPGTAIYTYIYLTSNYIFIF